MKPGNSFLVGINYFSNNGDFVRSEQVFGEIVYIAGDTISVKTYNDEITKAFPFIEGTIEPGDGGAYQFGDNNIPVIAPDFVATYRVTLPLKNA